MDRYVHSAVLDAAASQVVWVHTAILTPRPALRAPPPSTITQPQASATSLRGFGISITRLTRMYGVS